jgi:hydroxyacylglutathione hydrolase
VLNNVNVRTGIPGLHEPPWFLTTDPAKNRRSARKLLPLEPRLVLFGHGGPLRATRKFTGFVERLSG